MTKDSATLLKRTLIIALSLPARRCPAFGSSASTRGLMLRVDVARLSLSPTWRQCGAAVGIRAQATLARKRRSELSGIPFALAAFRIDVPERTASAAACRAIAEQGGRPKRLP